jgi:hypothetical protein
MYASGQTDPLPTEEVRKALRRLESAVGRHQQALRAEAGSGAELEMLRATVDVVSEELDRLRILSRDQA